MQDSLWNKAQELSDSSRNHPGWGTHNQPAKQEVEPQLCSCDMSYNLVPQLQQQPPPQQIKHGTAALTVQTQPSLPGKRLQMHEDA